MVQENSDNVFEMANISINALVLKNGDELRSADLDDGCFIFTVTSQNIQTENGKCTIRRVRLFRRCFNDNYEISGIILEENVINRDNQCFSLRATPMSVSGNCFIKTTNFTVPLDVKKTENVTELNGCFIFEKDMNATLYCGHTQTSPISITSYKQLIIHNIEGQVRLNTTNPVLKIPFSFDMPPKIVFSFDFLAFCLTDDNVKISGTGGGKGVICDFNNSRVTGMHNVFVIRSSELVDVTLKYQSPIQIYIPNVSPQIEARVKNDLDSVELVVYPTEVTNLTCSWSDSVNFLSGNCNDTVKRADLSDSLLTMEGCTQSGCTIQTIRVNIPPKISLKVDVYGIPETPVSSNRIVLYSGVSLNGYNDSFTLNNIKYSWYLNSTFKAKTQTFIIKGNTYKGGDKVTVILNVTANCNGVTGIGRARKIIQYALQPLVAITDSYQRSLSQGENLYIDASKSYNPNWPESVLRHQWTCYDFTKEGLCKLDDTIVYNQSYLTVDASFLYPGQRLKFIDYISDKPLNSTLSTIVTIQPRNAPTVTLLPSSQVFINFIDSIRTQAFVQSSGGHLDTEWHLFESDTNKSIDISKHFPNTKRSFDDTDPKQSILLSFTLTPGSNIILGLSSNKSYVIRLLAKNSAGIGWADRILSPKYIPLKLEVEVSADDPIYALETPVTLELVNKSINLSNSYIRFGIRSRSVGNVTADRWSRFSALKKYTTYLPSTIGDNNNTSECSTRASYQGLVELCDFNGYCIRGETQEFNVMSSRNFEKAYDNIMKMIDTDMESGALHNAIDKLLAVYQENCTAEVNKEIFDTLASKMISQISSSSDILELMEGMQYLNNVILWSSPGTMTKISEISSKVKYILGLESKNGKKREKRNADLMTAMAFGSGSRISEDMADELLRAYDLLISKNQQSETLYLSNIDDLLSAFCVQTDSNNMMEASGGKYTDIKLQALMPSYDSFLNDSYTLAGNSGDTIEFNSNFKVRYSEWKCSNGNVSCSEICLGSAQVKQEIFDDNEFMRSAFTSPMTSSTTIYDLVSDLFRIVFMDPINGQDVQMENYIQYTVQIPMINYSAALYYKCFIYTDSWNGDLCLTSNYAHKSSDSGYLMQCQCTSNGYIGVFKTAPSTPTYMPFYNEISLEFNTTQQGACTIDESKMAMDNLASTISVEENRFVNITSCNENGTFTAILRPALKQNQTSNSYVVQSIRKTVQQPGGFVAGVNFTINNVTIFIVARELFNDGNARRLSLRIDKTLKEVAPSHPDLVAQQWIQSMATNMRISEFRFKNYAILMGVMFNFTITLPFPGEISEERDLSAEVISLIIQEQIEYDELQLCDSDGQPLPIDPLTDIYQLVVAEQLNTLVVVLGVFITLTVTLGAILAGGLVVIKVRTDKLIQAHNREFDEHMNHASGPSETYDDQHAETLFFK
ncbi:unnamed protein product [Bursaphelenchus xylophilus]|uniref:(pine wood nematode) hypothetical protein n=1 Tax=Bursaphelenchus xylophilus TaxID=6326 RepID=A0A1I7SDB2_BURXY|nr:unnamed protein product [Bursaphelenchus xylophilus]CAG9130575.1 unnamed protein product [Bursaphelenchus xylophilus]